MGSAPKLTWLGVTAFAFGILLALFLIYGVEPWVVETLCRELLRCG